MHEHRALLLILKVGMLEDTWWQRAREQLLGPGQGLDVILEPGL